MACDFRRFSLWLLGSMCLGKMQCGVEAVLGFLAKRKPEKGDYKKKPAEIRP